MSGVVYEKNGVKVIAFEVDHGDVIKPAYGYRIEYGGRSAVISGDTRYNKNIIKYGSAPTFSFIEVATAKPRTDVGSLHPANTHRPSHDAARSR